MKRILFYIALIVITIIGLWVLGYGDYFILGLAVMISIGLITSHALRE